jgi:type II secretory pathway pseudopilin PulG
MTARRLQTLTKPPRGARGFSLIELMVAIIAGMLVVSAMLAFTVSSVRSNAEFVTVTRLTQELRATMDFATHELRRAGYDQDYMAQISRLAGASEASDFSPILLNNNCVVYAYDREPGVAGQVDEDNGEVRALRRVTVNGVGVIEIATTDATNTEIGCNDTTANYATYPPTCVGPWCALTDSRTLDITGFTITDASPDVIEASGLATMPLRIRQFDITIAGRLRGNPDAVRSVTSSVRVRADCLRNGMTNASYGACVAIPSS